MIEVYTIHGYTDYELVVINGNIILCHPSQASSFMGKPINDVLYDLIVEFGFTWDVIEYTANEFMERF